MEDTVRALVVIGVAALLLAPLTNAILDDTVPTADRRFLDDLEYEGDPPPFTPDGEPPEGFEPPPGEGEFEGEFDGPMPTCNSLDWREAAEWVHDQPPSSVTGRTESEKTFTVRETDLGVRATFSAEGVYGDLVAYLTPPGSDDIEVGGLRDATGDRKPPVPFEIRRGEPGFSLGTWSASIDFSGTITYQRLQYTLIIGSCAEAPR